MASNYMTDIGDRLTVGGMPQLKHSTSRKNNTSELDMTDFLNLMVVQLQNQTLDSSMDTSDMLNQLVQMQMITALANVTDASVMSYASSLVGKEVTIGDWSSGELVEKVVEVTGSGMSNGKQVLFAGNDVYDLSSVMAVGRLPDKGDGEEEDDENVEGVDGTESTDRTESAGGTESTDRTESTGGTESTDRTESTGGVESTDRTESTGGAESTDRTDSTGGTESTNNIDTSGMPADLINAGSATAQEKNVALTNFLDEMRIEVDSNAGPEEKAQAALDFLAEQRESGGGSFSARLRELVEQFLNATHIGMAQDSTDEERIQAMESVLRSMLGVQNRPGEDGETDETEDDESQEVAPAEESSEVN